MADLRNQNSSELKKALENTEPEHAKNRNRVDVIVETAKIDSILNQLIVKRLAPTSHDQDELLSEGGPMGSFNLRSKMAKRLGLVSEDLYAVLKDLSLIRNRCAHSDERFEVFSDDSVKQRIDNIWTRLDSSFQELAKTKIPTTRQKFKLICRILVVVLEIAAEKSEPLLSSERESVFKDEELKLKAK